MKKTYTIRKMIELYIEALDTDDTVLLWNAYADCGDEAPIEEMAYFNDAMGDKYTAHELAELVIMSNQRTNFCPDHKYWWYDDDDLLRSTENPKAYCASPFDKCKLIDHIMDKRDDLGDEMIHEILSLSED